MSFHLIPLHLEEVRGGTLTGSQTLATLLLVILSTIRIVVTSLCRLAYTTRTVEGVISLPITTALRKWNEWVSLHTLTSKISHDVRQIHHVLLRHQVNQCAGTCNSVPTKIRRKYKLPSSYLELRIICLIRVYAFTVKRKNISGTNAQVCTSHQEATTGKRKTKVPIPRAPGNISKRNTCI